MALTYDQLSSITQKHFIPKLVDNFFKSNALFNRLQKKGTMKVSGGLKISQPVLYKNISAAGAFSGWDLLDTTPNETRTLAEFDWAHYYANISLSRDDELKNMGPEQVINLVKDEVQLAEISLKDLMGTDLFADYAAKKLLGLRKVCKASDTSNPYGGISTTDFSGWAAKIDSSTGLAALTVKLMQDLWMQLVEDTNQPTVGFTTNAIFIKYFDLLDDNKRYVDSDTLDGGFTNLTFNNKPLIVDSHCPAGHLFMLNEDYLKLAVHPAENFRFEPFQKPVNQAAQIAKIYWFGQLICSNRRFQGAFTALT